MREQCLCVLEHLAAEHCLVLQVDKLLGQLLASFVGTCQHIERSLYLLALESIADGRSDELAGFLGDTQQSSRAEGFLQRAAQFTGYAVGHSGRCRIARTLRPVKRILRISGKLCKSSRSKVTKL